MIAVNIEPKQLLPDNGSFYRTQAYYITKNFDNKMIPYINKAIDYYYSRYENFFRYANLRLQQQLLEMNQVQSLEEIFKSAFAQWEKNAMPAWFSFQKMTTSAISNRLQELNLYTNELEASANNKIELFNFINSISQDYSNSIDGTPVNLNSVKSYIDGLTTRGNDTRALGGLRSDAFGELFEQGINNFLLEHTNGLVNVIQTGSSLNNNGEKIKSDGLISINNITLTSTEKGSNNSIKMKNWTIPIEGSTIFDLSSSQGIKGLNTILNNPFYSGILGISIKSWVSSTNTLGNFAISAQEINNRSGNVYTEWFKSAETFKLYSGYVASKYLVNIIGIHNALMATGKDSFTPTYSWLFNIYNNNRMIYNIPNISGSRMSRSGQEYGGKYKVHNKVRYGQMGGWGV